MVQSVPSVRPLNQLVVKGDEGDTCRIVSVETLYTQFTVDGNFAWQSGLVKCAINLCKCKKVVKKCGSGREGGGHGIHLFSSPHFVLCFTRLGTLASNSSAD